MVSINHITQSYPLIMLLLSIILIVLHVLKLHPILVVKVSSNM